MATRSRLSLLLAPVLGLPVALGLVSHRSSSQEPAGEVSPYVLSYSMTRIDGTSERLDTYKGKVILLVNVASKCGLTPQYEGLQALYEAKKEKGFIVLAFPANNFMGQEPGTNEEIAAFCESRYNVTFPMFEKVSVKGKDACELYKHLASLPKPLGGEPSWNFTKFLIDREGNVVQRFEPRTKPDAKELVSRIDELLASP